MDERMEGRMEGRMDGCMHACMHACMYVCLYPHDENRPGNRPVEGESGEDDSEAEGPSTASPDSGRRKPTRRGGRRARHRKLAALARQQAAAEAAVQEDSPGGGFGGTEQAEAYAISSVSPEPSAMGPDRPRTATSASSPLTVSPEPGVASGVEDGHQLIGRMVIIIDLIRSPEFNGQWGRVESYDPQMQRFVVRVAQTSQLPGDGPLLAKLRRENLVVPSSDAAPWHLTTLPEALLAARCAMGVTYDQPVIDGICSRLRVLVQDAFQRHLYGSAIFFADKLVSLRAEQEEIYTLAECYFKNREYRDLLLSSTHGNLPKRRVLHLLKKYGEATEQSHRLKLLVAQSLTECRDWEET
eukprot:s5690_g1.t1